MASKSQKLNFYKHNRMIIKRTFQKGMVLLEKRAGSYMELNEIDIKNS